MINGLICLITYTSEQMYRCVYGYNIYALHSTRSRIICMRPPQLRPPMLELSYAQTECGMFGVRRVRASGMHTLDRVFGENVRARCLSNCANIDSAISWTKDWHESSPRRCWMTSHVCQLSLCVCAFPGESTCRINQVHRECTIYAIYDRHIAH